MKASELIKILRQLIKDNGDQIIRLVDHESGWCCNTVTNVKVLQKNKYQPYTGFLLEDGEIKI
jgi:hypothetical protein